MTDVRASLARAARLGTYFESDDVSGDGWRPLRELVDDAGVLTERVATVGGALARRAGTEVEVRTSASIDSLGVMSRLVAAPLATGCLDGVVPTLDLDSVLWRAVDTGPMPVAFAASSGRDVDGTDEAAVALVELVIEPVVRPLLEAYHARFGVSLQTLWGNLASALNGAAGMLPEIMINPLDVVAALLQRGALVGAGRYDMVAGQRVFARNNCCLIYRVPGSGVCGDCVLSVANRP